MNKEFTRMQKLAGIITEGLYTSDAKASMEAMSNDGESRMTKRKLKEKIKGMMNQEGYMGTPYDSSDDMALDMIKTGAGLPRGTMEGAPGDITTKEMGSMDEANSDYTAAAYKIAKELIRRMPFPDAVLTSKDLFIATIGALHDELYSYAEDQFGNAGSAPDEYDDYDDSMDVYDDGYQDMAETMFEAKKDEESDTEDVIVADTTEEVPAEDTGMEVSTDDTKVDVNMDGVPDVDTGSAESRKAFTSLVDTYNASKQLGDAKLTQMIANALTYYNKNIILKTSQPQA